MLERVAARHVEVCLGLVEQQQAGPAREAGGERDELALAAAQLARGPGERVVVEPERAQVRARLALGALAAELGPLAEQPLLVGERALHLPHVARERRVGESLLGLSELALERGQLRPRVEHGGERRAVVALDDLRQRREHEPAAAGDGAGVGVLLAGEDAQQRRLAAAVRSEHADAGALRELEVEPGQHLATTERLREAAGRQQRDRRYEPASAKRVKPASTAASATSRSAQPWTVTSLPSGCLYIE